LSWGGFDDEESFRATPQMIKEGLSLLNKYYYDCMIKGYDPHHATKEEVDLIFKVIMKLGGIYGFFPTMKAYTSEHGGNRFIQLANEKIKRDFEEAKRVRIVGHPQNFNVLPELIDFAPHGYPSDKYIRAWQGFARDAGMPEYDLEKFIVWEEKGYGPEGFRTLADLIKSDADSFVNRGQREHDARYKELCQDYVAWMAYLPMSYKFGPDFNELPFEKKAPYLQLVTNRLHWQLTEIHFIIQFCFHMMPYYLARYPVKVPSGHYDESLKFERTQQDLVNEKAIELTNLPRFSAYTKVLFEKDNKQTVWTGKIQTKPLSQVTSDLEAAAIAQGHEICKLRFKIESEIRERQEKWRSVPQTPTASQPPPTPKPPPTSD
jgi:hypothetical protein